MQPDLNRLRIFYHVYRLQSIKMAAEVLFLTQPGVSQHIQKLESEIKTPLFIRCHKKIIPTQAANQLFKLVKPFMETISDQMQYITSPMNEPCGRLRIGMPLEFGKTYMPAICNDFRQTHVKVSFKIRLEEPDQILDMVNQGDLDFAVIDFFSAKDQFLGRPEQYRIQPLASETFVLVCARSYFENRMQNDISYESLIEQDFLTDEHQPIILKHWIWHYYKRTISNINIVMAIDSHQALLRCVRLGMGLAITADHLIKEDVEKGLIVPIFPTKDRVINQMSLVRIREKKLTLTEEVFQAFLIDRLQEQKSL